jgi:hypothetical protein
MVCFRTTSSSLDKKPYFRTLRQRDNCRAIKQHEQPPTAISVVSRAARVESEEHQNSAVRKATSTHRGIPQPGPEFVRSIAALTAEPERAVRRQKLYTGPTKHTPTSSVTLRRAAARFAHKRDEPRAERGLKPLDVGGGVVHRAFTALGRARSSPQRLLGSADDAPDHPGHSSPSVSLERLGDHEALRHKESGAPSLAGAKRLAKHLQRLLGIARKPIGGKQKALQCSTSAHAKQAPDQGALAPYLHHAPQPEPTARAHRPGQPKHPSHNPHTQLIGLNLPRAGLSL